MTLFEMYGRYAEDPPVVVEAPNAEVAATLAIERRLAIRPGYHPGGALIPTALSPEQAKRYRERMEREL